MVGKEELKRIAFIGDLPEEMLEDLGRISNLREVEEDTVLFEQGEELTTLYMLLSGTVVMNSRSPAGRVLTLDQVLPGQSFGISALMGEGRSSFTAICGEKSSLLTVDTPALKKLFEEKPAMGYQVMLRVVKRFKSRSDHATRQLILSLASHPDIKGIAG